MQQNKLATHSSSHRKSMLSQFDIPGQTFRQRFLLAAPRMAPLRAHASNPRDHTTDASPVPIATRLVSCVRSDRTHRSVMGATEPLDLAKRRGGEVRVSGGGRLTLRAPRPEAARYMMEDACEDLSTGTSPAARRERRRGRWGRRP